MFSTKRQKYSRFFIIIVVFIFTRFLFIFFTPYAYYNEEAKIGSLGHDILFEKGLRLPFWGYLDSPHSGGSIFSGLVAVPFYYIFGNRYLALKMAALFFSLLTIVLWYRLILSEAGEKRYIYILFLIFFIFATPHYVQKSVILAGNTVELMFFNILVISCFWKIKKNLVIKPISYFFLGLLCGFSFWVQFMSFYFFLAIILTLFITERFKQATFQVFYILIGFSLGMLPLWIYNFQYKWVTLTHIQAVERGFFSFDSSKLKYFLFADLPKSFHFLDIGNIKAEYISFIVYGAFILAVIVHLGSNFKIYIREFFSKKINIRLELFLILYFAIFIFVTCFTRFPIGSADSEWNSMNLHAEYYIVSFQPIIFALLILLNKYKSKILTLVNILVSIIFILGYVNSFSGYYYNNTLFEPMHSTESNATECGFKFIHNPELFFGFDKKLSSDLRDDYFYGAGMKINDFLTDEIKAKKIFSQLSFYITDEMLWSSLLKGALVGDRIKSIDSSYRVILSILPEKFKHILEKVYTNNID